MAEAAAQDLNHEPLLKSIRRETIGAKSCPVIATLPLLSKIGESAGAAVYLAFNAALQADVAAKVIAYDPVESPGRFNHFQSDLRKAQNVLSPRLVKLHSSGPEGEIFYILMEYVPGQSAQEHLNKLRERLKPGYDETSALEACIAVTEGLVAIHKANQTHLCLRPSSILIPRAVDSDKLDFAHAKLADFGMAYDHASGTLLAGTAAETGVPGFMSPEQCSGAPIDKFSDIFSMGAVLYALLVGQPPFGGMSIHAVLSSTNVQEPSALRTWRPDVSRATSAIIDICLRKDGMRRFSDASQLLEALKIAYGSRDSVIGAQLAAVGKIEQLLPALPATAADEKTMMGSWVVMSGKDKEDTQTAKPAASALKSSAVESAAAFEPTIMSSSPIRPPKEPEPEPTMIVAGVRAEIKHETGNYTDLIKPYKPSLPQAPPPPVMTTKPVEQIKPVIQEVEEDELQQKTRHDEITLKDDWSDPTLDAGLAEPPPRRASRAPLVALLLLVVLAGGAYQFGYLDSLLGIKPRKIAKLPPVTPPTPPGPPVANITPNDQKTPDDTAKAEQAKQEEEQRRLAAEKAEKAEQDKRDAEARLKAQQEEEQRKLAAAKAEKEKAEAEARAKAEKEKADAEALRLQQQEEEQRKLAAAKAEKEKAEAEARAKAEKAEKDRLAAEALKAQEEEQRKIAAAKAEKEKAEADALAKAEAEKAEKAKLEAVAAQKLREEQERQAEAKRQAAIAAAKAAELANKDFPKEVQLDLGAGVTMQMVYVPPGEFTMGSERDTLLELAKSAGAELKEFEDEMPQHPMKAGGFYIGKTPVTVAQFKRFVNATHYQTAAERQGEGFVLRNRSWQRLRGASWRQPGFPQDDNHPVVFLSWRDCIEFGNWLGQLTGKPVRLPTEAEWEYAARGTKNNLYPWGNSWNGKLANHSDKRLKKLSPDGWICSADDDGFAFTAPVGRYENASWCGALDMSGNVFQWCSDPYLPYQSVVTSPVIILDEGDSPKESRRVLRGGSFLFRPVDCRTATRRNESQRAYGIDFGMRLVFRAE